MAIALVAPSLDLAPVVRVFVDAEIGEAQGQRLMPEPGMVLALRYRGSADLVDASGSARLASASLIGVAGRARMVYATARGGVVLVIFRTSGRRTRSPIDGGSPVEVETLPPSEAGLIGAASTA